jgi:hypothetical protein
MKYTNGLDSITHEAIEDFEDQQGWRPYKWAGSYGVI